MAIRRKIRVLIIDDSLLFREAVAQGLSMDPAIEVIGKASDPYMARDMIIDLEPDVLTLDVEMPRMSGIEFLRRLMPQYPLPVVMLSSANSKVFEALKAGAVEFVSKPDAGKPGRLDAMIRELSIKIKIASTARVNMQKQMPPRQKARLNSGSRGKVDLVAIGASTGGTDAVDRILRALPPQMPPIVVVQHMPPVFTKLYAERLNQISRLNVREAVNGFSVQPGDGIIAAGDHHLTVIKKEGRLVVESKQGQKVNGHCPSVDRLFESICQLTDTRVIGILLTGMGQDGAKGLYAMREQGFPTIGQDEASCVVYGMPKVAYEMGAVEYQTPLSEISDLLLSILAEG